MREKIFHLIIGFCVLFSSNVLTLPTFGMEQGEEGDSHNLQRSAPKKEIVKKEEPQREKEKPSPILAFKWVPSLNFLYNGKFALEERDSAIDSHRMADWHIGQADKLAYFYNTYQGGAARNVLRAMFSIIYAQDGKLKIKHCPIDNIFMSGWLPEDTPLGPYKGSYIELPSYTKHTKVDFNKSKSDPFAGTKICTLGTVLKDHNLTFDNFLAQHKLTTQKEVNAAFKEEECHAEKTVFFYLNLNLDQILNHFLKDVKGTIVVKDFLLSMASYRDMCPICIDNFTKGSPTYPLKRLETEIIKKLKGKCEGKTITFTSTPEVTVCFSSFSPHSLEERTKSGYTTEARPRHYKWMPHLKAYKFYLMESPYTVIRTGQPQSSNYNAKLTFVPAFFRIENYTRPPSFDDKWEEDNNNK